MLENIYFLLEEFTMIICLFGLYGKKIKIDILTMVAIVINMVLFSMARQGYMGHIYSLIALIVLFIYSLFEHKAKLKQSVTNMFLCIELIMLIQLVGIIPMSLLRIIIKNDSILLIVMNLLVMLVITVMKDKLLHISNSILNGKGFSTFAVLMSIFSVVVLLINYKTYKTIKYDIYFIVTAFIGLIISLLYKWYVSKMELKLREEQLKIASLYEETLYKLNEDVRKRHHDIKNHINAIFSMHYTYNTYEELVANQRKYCDYIVNEGRFDKLLSINAPILAGFLYYKFQEIEKCGIHIDYRVDFDAEQIQIPMYEIISILGIYIDNARENAESLGANDRKIIVDFYEDNKYIYFKVKNISEYIKYNDIKKLFTSGYSTKGNDRGIGLYTVKEKSEKYGFDILVQNEELENINWIVFGMLISK